MQQQATTASDGSFRFGHLPLGVYDLVATTSRSLAWPLTAWLGGHHSETWARRVSGRSASKAVCRVAIPAAMLACQVWEACARRSWTRAGPSALRDWPQAHSPRFGRDRYSPRQCECGAWRSLQVLFPLTSSISGRILGSGPSRVAVLHAPPAGAGAGNARSVRAVVTRSKACRRAVIASRSPVACWRRSS